MNIHKKWKKRYAYYILLGIILLAILGQLALWPFLHTQTRCRFYGGICTLMLITKKADITFQILQRVTAGALLLLLLRVIYDIFVFCCNWIVKKFKRKNSSNSLRIFET